MGFYIPKCQTFNISGFFICFVAFVLSQNIALAQEAPVKTYGPIEVKDAYTYAEALKISEIAPVFYASENVVDDAKLAAKEVSIDSGLYVLALPGNADPNIVTFFAFGKEVKTYNKTQYRPITPGITIKIEEMSKFGSMTTKIEGEALRYFMSTLKLKSATSMVTSFLKINPPRSPDDMTLVLYDKPTEFKKKEAISYSENAVVLYVGRQKKYYATVLADEENYATLIKGKTVIVKTHEDYEPNPEPETYMTAGDIMRQNSISTLTLTAKKRGKFLTVYAFGEKILHYKNGEEAMKSGTVTREVGEYLRQYKPSE